MYTYNTIYIQFVVEFKNLFDVVRHWEANNKLEINGVTSVLM